MGKQTTNSLSRQLRISQFEKALQEQQKALKSISEERLNTELLSSIDFESEQLSNVFIRSHNFRTNLSQTQCATVYQHLFEKAQHAYNKSIA